MALATGILILTALVLAIGAAVLSAIAAAIEVLPSPPGLEIEPIADEQSPANASCGRVSHES